jgi:L-lactate dehydrogenase complex protein LldF
MQPTSLAFKDNAHRAMADPTLQAALGFARGGFPAKRSAAAARLPEFEALRDEATALKDHTLAHLDLYLEAFERRVIEQGGKVHWARDAAEARALVLKLCRAAGARSVTKSKSMICEEIGLNEALEANGIAPVETDLGEYIVQLAGEKPSHILAPAIHMTKERVADLFAEHHGRPRVEAAEALLNEARQALRARYFAAEVGITGANFLVAETGSVVLVTNEGNAELTQGLPKTHIVVASLEKVVPTLEDACTMLRVLARSATGQEFSAYTTIVTGPKRPADHDGPSQLHIVLVDNGRSSVVGSEFQDILRCIRCGACMNHCPVYLTTGGHAYGWVYPGPMGAVLTPQFIGIEQGRHLPNASSFCGRCEAVCPVRIPLPKMMRHWREQEFAKGLSPPTARYGTRLWALAARHPALYHAGARVAIALLGLLDRLTGRHGRFRRLPLAGGWTGTRDLPAPAGRTFQSLWQARARGQAPGERS